MKAGTLDRRVTFQSFTTTPDGAGGATKAWTDFAKLWAQFSPERARERIQNGRISSAQAGVLRVRLSRRSQQIDDTFRVVVDDVLMNVRSVTVPDQQNDMIELAVETDGTES
ncbi:phage head-tail adaptor, putative, SPP1 family [Bradyrhizobium sp. NFR13]|uniref:phage head closure protein n=1 Tax=Bradyrhizobium sp. NFR13 TaxID=1566285 RepID=UPI0008E0FB0D|nr:phage head closure protein [Bradyrhizobium sp. NFR13]SFM00605.1 phage head-tail adaptor, putative, SPP1 family [Bradyrhizobium sp. NFR13]